MNHLCAQTYADQVITLLKLEADAITQAANRLCPEDLNQAVQRLATCQGKVILLGVGKSGIVARKIAATLTSTGTHAVYLHPADALHGDLGIVTSQDVAIALSNSGETDELISLFPYLKRRHVPIIAIVGKLNSTLARLSTIRIDASVNQEACPFNLAPTTSTTVALAIGDALAMSVMQAKGVTPEEFAFNHPAGQLGKRLTLTVGDLMHSESPSLLPESSWLEVLSAISQGGLGAVNIVDRKGALLGLITDGDLRRWVQKTPATELASLTANHIMTRNPVTVSEAVLAYDALRLMENRPSQIAVLPVVNDHHHCLGLVRLHDLVHCGL